MSEKLFEKKNERKKEGFSSYFSNTSDIALFTLLKKQNILFTTPQQKLI